MANNSTTSAGIISTAPAPISAEARATCAALSASSARASANSLPISLASWLTASPSKSGIERLLAEAITVPFVSSAAARIARCAPGAGIAGAVMHAHVELLAVRSFRRTLQKAHSAKAGEHRKAEERGRLTAGEVLGLTDKIVEISG